MSDIVERLRTNVCPDNHGCGVMPNCACADMEDAADEIARLRAQLDTAREALNSVDNIVLNLHDHENAIRSCIGDELTNEAIYTFHKCRHALAELDEATELMIRFCPKRDAICPHGPHCPYAVDRYTCLPEPKSDEKEPSHD